MEKKVSLFLSYVFQPLLMPSFVFVFLLFGTPSANSLSQGIKIYILGLILMTTFVIPLLTLLVLKIQLKLSSIDMIDRKERIIPFLSISILYTITSFLFYRNLDLKEELVMAMFCITASVVLLAITTSFWKISAHMIGLSGLIGIILAYSINSPNVQLLQLLSGLILITGAVGSSRLFLNIHRPIEIFGGFILGFAICFIPFYQLAL